MNIKQLKDYFSLRLKQVDELAEKTNKSTVLVIQQFPIDLDTEILVPNVRESISNIIAFVELGDMQALQFVIKAADGVFDAIVADIDLKCSFSANFISYVKENVKKSLLFFYNDNYVWAESALNYIQVVEHGIVDKNILLCGEGVLFDQLLNRVVAAGGNVFLLDKNQPAQYSFPVDASGRAAKVSFIKNDSSLKKINIVIGSSLKKVSLAENLLDQFGCNVDFYDIGIGNFPEKIIELIETKHFRVFRLDNRAGISGLLISLFETNYLISEMMGRVKVKGVEIVAGGIMGKNGSIIVDNIKNPSYIIGIADGRGKVKAKPDNKEELKNIQFVQKLIDK